MTMRKFLAIVDHWGPTLIEIAYGDFPHRPTLAKALRGEEPVPPEVRKFLADLLEGKIKDRRKGRPKSKNIVHEGVENDVLKVIFRVEYDRIKCTPRSNRRIAGTPFEVALERTAMSARNHGIYLKPDAIKKRLNLRDRSQRDR